MFSLLSNPQILAILLGTGLFYLLIVAVAYGRKHFASPQQPVPAPAVDVSASAGAALLGPIVPTPAVNSASSPYPAPVAEARELTEEEWLELDFGDIPDDEFANFQTEPITLLKEAERVVEMIQKAVEPYTYRPANPDEIMSVIRNIVSDYTFFFDTSYYDAINRFVAITVHRDCDLELTEADLQSLWYAAAA